MEKSYQGLKWSSYWIVEISSLVTMKNEDRCCKDMTSLFVSFSICNFKELIIEFLKVSVII